MSQHQKSPGADGAPPKHVTFDPQLQQQTQPAREPAQTQADRAEAMRDALIEGVQGFNDAAVKLRIDLDASKKAAKKDRMDLRQIVTAHAMQLDEMHKLSTENITIAISSQSQIHKLTATVQKGVLDNETARMEQKSLRTDLMALVRTNQGITPTLQAAYAATNIRAEEAELTQLTIQRNMTKQAIVTERMRCDELLDQQADADAETDRLAAKAQRRAAITAEIARLRDLSDDDEEDDLPGQASARHIREPSPSRIPRDHVKVPQPQSYSGDSHEDVDEILFSFENYLSGNNIIRSRWTVHAMQLLKGRALAAYIAFAQPLQKQGITPTWEQFVSVMHTAFVTHDRQLEARNALFNTVQSGSVTGYLQSFRVLISRAGSPAPCDKDLLLHYWKGLKQSVKDESKIDPTTGAFLASFEDLARHTITISRQSDLNPHTTPLTSWDKNHKAHLQLKATQLKLKAALSNTPAGPYPKQGRGYNSAGGGRGHGRDGGRGGGFGGGRGDGRPPRHDNGVSAGPSKPGHCNGNLPNGRICGGGGGYHLPGCPKA